MKKFIMFPIAMIFLTIILTGCIFLGERWGDGGGRGGDHGDRGDRGDRGGDHGDRGSDHGERH